MYWFCGDMECVRHCVCGRGKQGHWTPYYRNILMRRMHSQSCVFVRSIIHQLHMSYIKVHCLCVKHSGLGDILWCNMNNQQCKGPHMWASDTEYWSNWTGQRQASLLLLLRVLKHCTWNKDVWISFNSFTSEAFILLLLMQTSIMVMQQRYCVLQYRSGERRYQERLGHRCSADLIPRLRPR